MIFTSLSLLNRWGTPASANTTVTNYRAVKRRASHRAYTALTAYAPPFPHSNTCSYGYHLVKSQNLNRGYGGIVRDAWNCDGSAYQAPIAEVATLRKELNKLVGNSKDTIELCVAGVYEVPSKDSEEFASFIKLKPSTREIQLQTGEVFTLSPPIIELLNVIYRGFPDVLKRDNKKPCSIKQVDNQNLYRGTGPPCATFDAEHGAFVMALLSVNEGFQLSSIKQKLVVEEKKGFYHKDTDLVVYTPQK